MFYQVTHGLLHFLTLIFIVNTCYDWIGKHRFLAEAEALTLEGLTLGCLRISSERRKGIEKKFECVHMHVLSSGERAKGESNESCRQSKQCRR